MDSPSSVTSNPFATSSSPVTLSAATIQLINIKQHVPVVLDLTQPNYSTWSTFFMVAFGIFLSTFRKFGVQDHIDGTVDARHRQYDAEWIQIDYSIVSCLYTSVSQEIVDIILKPDDTAFGVWTTIHNIFLGNRNQRAVYALQEFHNLYQGDTSITAYLSRLKLLADTLRDVGEPVSDQDALPTFFNARTYLLQEERRLAHTAAAEAHHALYARTPGGAPAPFIEGNGGKKGKQKNKKGKGHNSGGAAPPAGGNSGGQAPLHPLVAALAGLFQALPVQRPPAPSAGVLGPRPGVSAPALHAVHAPGAHQHGYGAPPPAPTSYSFMPGTFQHVPGAYQPAPTMMAMPAPQPQSQYDHGPLLQALSNLAMQASTSSTSGQPEWVMDTGASSHMAAHPGWFDQGGAPPM